MCNCKSFVPQLVGDFFVEVLSLVSHLLVTFH
jgi:hypothetical protein